jgi:molybdenum cofactor cytidylyltransferase
MMVNILILAAGSSSRLGQSKQKFIVGGVSLLAKTVQVALNSKARHVHVVLGSKAEEHQQLIAGLPVETVYHEQWERGMGSSLKAGMKVLLEKHPDTAAVIVMVCDQPFLTTSILDSLITTYQHNSADIVACSYKNVHGVPALFSRSVFPTLLEIDDAQGARKIIQHHPGTLLTVPFEKGEIDLDTPADLDRLKP